MKRRLVLAFCATLLLGTAPATASLFDFHFGSLTSTYDGTNNPNNFTTSIDPTLSSGSLTRQRVPVGVANFLGGQWGLGGDFSLTMTITNVTGTSADGAGTFAIMDTTGDVISGNLAGTWSRVGVSNVFASVLTNVTFANNSTDSTFNGHIGSASMIFPQPTPWHGTLIQLSTTGTWFNEGPYTTRAGSVDASVVPVPGGVLLGMIGLGMAGMKLRKRA